VTRLTRLVHLYPRGWRQRYGDEFTDLVASMAAERPSRLRLAVDLGRGAVDAHLYGRYGMRRHLSDAALRRGIYDGLIIAAVMAVTVVLTVVVFPQNPNESDSEPEYVIPLMVGYALLGVLLIAIGARGWLRSGTLGGAVRAGAAAGFVIALLAMLDYLIVNNLFFSIVSQQHDKRVAFAASGWTSMRAFINYSLLTGAVFAVPVATVIGGVLGLAGGAFTELFRRGRRSVGDGAQQPTP
jgi:hypothetical protein